MTDGLIDSLTHKRTQIHVQTRTVADRQSDKGGDVDTDTHTHACEAQLAQMDGQTLR